MHMRIIVYFLAYPPPPTELIKVIICYTWRTTDYHIVKVYLSTFIFRLPGYRDHLFNVATFWLYIGLIVIIQVLLCSVIAIFYA